MVVGSSPLAVAWHLRHCVYFRSELKRVDVRLKRKKMKFYKETMKKTLIILYRTKNKSLLSQLVALRQWWNLWHLCALPIKIENWPKSAAVAVENGPKMNILNELLDELKGSFLYVLYEFHGSKLSVMKYGLNLVSWNSLKNVFHSVSSSLNPLIIFAKSIHHRCWIGSKYTSEFFWIFLVSGLFTHGIVSDIYWNCFLWIFGDKPCS